jgi:amidase
VVGIKPTVGLTSRAGVVPISHTQDTVGPHGRTVADAAAVLGAIASTIADPRDPSTAVNRDLVHDDYVQFLDPDGLRGARIGVARQLTGFSPETDAVFEAALQTMRDAGATLVDPADIPNLGTIAGGQDETVVLFYELKRDLNAYLATRTGVPIATLADAIAFNQAHADEELLWFGQEDFEFAESDPFDEATYLEAVARERRVAGPHGIDAALKAYGVDALVMETSSPASAIDLLNGDHFLGGSSYVAAQAGYPIVQVPAGNSFGLPVGISFVGTAYGEPTLIKLASGFEAAARARIVPTFQPFLPAEAPGRAPRLSRAAVRPRGRRQGLSLL